MDHLPLTADFRLTCKNLRIWASLPQVRIEIESAIIRRLQSSADRLPAILESGTQVYGWTTGFGAHIDATVAGEKNPEHAQGLLAHLGAGFGPSAPRVVVRAAQLARTISLCRGLSAIRPEVVIAYKALLEYPGWVDMPVTGSVGASGDLVPLSYIARALGGEGAFIQRNPGAIGDDKSGENSTIAQGEGVSDGKVPAQTVLEHLGLEPPPLNSRETLALVNGTSWSSAWAAVALDRLEVLLRIAEVLTGRLYAVLGAELQPLDQRLHEAKGHLGCVDAAKNIKTEVMRYFTETVPPSGRSLQEPYSLRTAPQVLGAARDSIGFAMQTVETELRGGDDNPLIFYRNEDSSQGAGERSEPPVVHGGNFQAQHIAFAADGANLAATQIGLLAERQLALLGDPQLNGGAPLLLASRPGVDSGIAGLQITMTALVAEMRKASSPSSVATIPTNGHNQDIVSMAAMAGRTLYEQTQRLAGILAGLDIGLHQLLHLRAAGQGKGPTVTLPDARSGMDADRPLGEELRLVTASFLEPEPKILGAGG